MSNIRSGQEPITAPGSQRKDTSLPPPCSDAMAPELHQQQQQRDVDAVCHSTVTVSPIGTAAPTPGDAANSPPDARVDYSFPSCEYTDAMHAASAAVRSDDAAHQTAPTKERGALSDDAVHKAMLIAQTCISSHSIQFLEANLARWCRHGLWHNSSPLNKTASLSGYEKLQRAYSFVYRLDTRMSEDAIRSRMAMVTLHLEYENAFLKWNTKRSRPNRPSTSVGRGHTSSIIDTILESVHVDWSCYQPREKAALRTKFHEWKRFGKRWWLLASILGPSIMLLASARFAGMV